MAVVVKLSKTIYSKIENRSEHEMLSVIDMQSLFMRCVRSPYFCFHSWTFGTSSIKANFCSGRNQKSRKGFEFSVESWEGNMAKMKSESSKYLQNEILRINNYPINIIVYECVI